MTRVTLRLAGAFVSLLLGANVGHAQVGTGFPPFGSFSRGAPDTINYGNLNVHLQIPIGSKAGRGLPFVYVLAYDSSIWSEYNALGDLAWTPSASPTFAVAAGFPAGASQKPFGYNTGLAEKH